MRRYRLTCAALLLSVPACNLPPLAQGAADEAPAVRESCPVESAAREPSAPPSLRQHVAHGTSRARHALACGYARFAEGIETAADSEAVRIAIRPFLYAFLVIGYCAPR